MSFELALTITAVFLSVVLASVSALSYVVGWSSSERRQLRRLSSDRGNSNVLQDIRLTDAPSAFEQRVQRFVPKSPKEMSRLRRLLATAGYHSRTAAVAYAASELMLALIFGSAVIAFRGISGVTLLLALLAAIVGYMVPSLWIMRRTAIRQKQIRNGLPDALDLLIVCIEAGSSVDQAIAKTTEELQLSYPALAEELRMVMTETKAGKPRIEAFKNFAARTKVDDVRALTAMLIQTDRFGTSIAQALRTHAETSRTKRRQRAEEAAGKIGVKLVFPLVFFLFPALWVVILGPAVIQYVRVFKGQIVQ